MEVPTEGLTVEQQNHSHEKTMEENLREIDRDMSSLYEYCQQSGMTKEEIEEALQPLFSAITMSKWKRRAQRWGLFLAVVVALVSIVSVGPIYRQLSILGRKYLIQILPLWDWTRYYYSDCIVTNPFYIGTQLIEEDCQACESLENFDRLSNVSASIIIDDYLKNDVPFIVTDAMDDWEIMNTDEFYFDNITELYLNEDDIHMMKPCSFLTNVRLRHYNLQNFFAKISHSTVKRWFGHWENCDKKAAKLLRQFYNRPYFLPAVVDLSESNWVLMSSDYLGRVYKEISVYSGLLMVAQIRGFNHIRVTPKKPCHSFCPEMTNILNEGEILVFTDFMWHFQYIPGEDSDNVAFAIGGFWD